MDFTVLWHLHRTNQSVQKLLPTRSSPVLCHELAKAADVRFRLSIQPAGCDADTCGAKVNSKVNRTITKRSVQLNFQIIIDIITAAVGARVTPRRVASLRMEKFIADCSWGMLGPEQFFLAVNFLYDTKL